MGYRRKGASGGSGADKRNRSEYDPPGTLPAQSVFHRSVRPGGNGSLDGNSVYHDFYEHTGGKRKYSASDAGTDYTEL